MKQYTSTSNNRILLSKFDLDYAAKNGLIPYANIKPEHIPHIANVPADMAACAYYALSNAHSGNHTPRDIDAELVATITEAAQAHQCCIDLQNSSSKPVIRAYTHIYRTDIGYAVSVNALSYAADMLRPDVIRVRNITQDDMDGTCLLPTLHAAKLLSRYAQGSFYGPDADPQSHATHIHNWASFRDVDGCRECVIRDGSDLLPLAAILADNDSSKEIHLGRAKLQLHLCKLYLSSAMPVSAPVAG